MYLNIVFEKLYNYWDKVGDYLAAHFPGAIKKKNNIYFSSIIDNLQDRFKDSNSYCWLKSFKESDYKIFNEKRKYIVHHFGTDTEYKWLFIKNHMNKEILTKAFNELIQFPVFLKCQMQFIREGIYYMLSFIEEV